MQVLRYLVYASTMGRDALDAKLLVLEKIHTNYYNFERLFILKYILILRY